MPVMTRSQRLKAQQRAQQQAEQQQIEGSRSVSESKEESEEASFLKSNFIQFRNYVKTMSLVSILDSPDGNKKSRKPMVVAPSPRVERITIANKTKHQRMEFLIPPKENDSAIEIREQIRAALGSPDSKPETGLLAPPKASSSNPIFNEKTKLWSPNAPSYNKKDAQRISRYLILAIICILTAVFIACYKEEIINFLQPRLAPLVQFVKQCWDWIISIVEGIWNKIFGGSEEQNVNETSE